MATPQVTGEALALHGMIQAQLQEVHNAMATMAADIAAVRLAVANEETRNRIAAIEQGMGTVNQHMELTAQTWETRCTAMSALVAAMTPSGTDRKNASSEFKPVDKLKEFGGGAGNNFGNGQGNW